MNRTQRRLFLLFVLAQVLGLIFWLLQSRDGRILLRRSARVEGNSLQYGLQLLGSARVPSDGKIELLGQHRFGLPSSTVLWFEDTLETATGFRAWVRGPKGERYPIRCERIYVEPSSRVVYTVTVPARYPESWSAATVEIESRAMGGTVAKWQLSALPPTTRLIPENVVPKLSETKNGITVRSIWTQNGLGAEASVAPGTVGTWMPLVAWRDLARTEWGTEEIVPLPDPKTLYFTKGMALVPGVPRQLPPMVGPTLGNRWVELRVPMQRFEIYEESVTIDGLYVATDRSGVSEIYAQRPQEIVTPGGVHLTVAGKPTFLDYQTAKTVELVPTSLKLLLTLAPMDVPSAPLFVPDLILCKKYGKPSLVQLECTTKGVTMTNLSSQGKGLVLATPKTAGAIRSLTFKLTHTVALDTVPFSLTVPLQ